jgi:hypothetical protein
MTSLHRAGGPDLKGAGDHRAAAAVASEAPASPLHTCRWGASQCEPWRCHAGAASRHGSPHITASCTKPARPTRVPLTFIYTAHTTHSHHRLPLAARIHSRAPADMFLVPARSPRKTRLSRRPRRSVRPLVRPTSFMRTTTPRSLPAKALSTMSRLRCAQSLHESEPGASSLQTTPSTAPSFPRGRLWPPCHDRPCFHPPHGMSTPCSALRMS